jgi:ribosome maturation factor RimP
MILKKERTGVEKKLYDLTEKVVKGENLNIYDVEYLASSGILRVFIIDEKTDTAQLDDCVRVDKAFNPYFESESWIPENITLQVSSPGIYRRLTTLEHFKAQVGKRIKVIFFKALGELVEDAPKKLKGAKILVADLLEVTEEGVVLGENDYKFSVGFIDIKKANLEVNLFNELRKES